MTTSLKQVDILLSTYINPMVTTNQKHTKDTQKLEKNHKHATKENYQTTKEETQEEKSGDRTIISK